MLNVKLLEVIYSPTSSITYWQIAYASGSHFFHIQIQLTFTERQVVWPSQYLTVPQRLFCGRVCLLHMATTFEDQEVLKQLFVFINDPVTSSHEFC